MLHLFDFGTYLFYLYKILHKYRQLKLQKKQPEQLLHLHKF